MAIEVTSSAIDGECYIKRTICLGYDNGNTPGSSFNTCGRQGFVRFDWAFTVLGWDVNSGTVGEGDPLGPFPSWTPQLQGWSDFFNANDPNANSNAAFGVLPAPTWRYSKITSCEPEACYGALRLQRDDGCLFEVFPLFAEATFEQVYECKNSDGSFTYYREDENGDRQKIDKPDDWSCYRPKTYAWKPFIKDGAESSCETQVFDNLCDTGVEPNVNFVAVIDDCDGSRTTTNYTLESWLTAEAPDDLVEYEPVGEIQVIAGNGSKTPFEPPVVSDECNELSDYMIEKEAPNSLGDPDCAFQVTIGRPNNGATWEIQQDGATLASGATYQEFSAAMQALGYQDIIAGPTREAHFFCPCPSGELVLLVNGEPVEVGRKVPISEIPNWPANLTKPASDLKALTTCDPWLLEAIKENTAAVKDLCEKLVITKPDDAEVCDFTVEFKSAGLTSVLSDKGEALTNGPYDFSSTTGPSPEMTAAQADIQAFLDANGGGTVTLSYPSDSILQVAITGTTCMFTSADDDSNPGPHEFTKEGGSTGGGNPEEHTVETNPFDPDRGQRWDAWIAQGNGGYTIQAAGGPGSEGWINTWANGNDQQIGTAYFTLARIATYSGPSSFPLPPETSDGYILIAPNQVIGNGGSPSTAIYDPTVPPIWSAGDVTCTREQMLGLLIAQGFSQAEATELVDTGTTQGLSIPVNGQFWTNGDFVNNGLPFGLWGVGV